MRAWTQRDWQTLSIRLSPNMNQIKSIQKWCGKDPAICRCLSSLIIIPLFLSASEYLRGLEFHFQVLNFIWKNVKKSIWGRYPSPPGPSHVMHTNDSSKTMPQWHSKDGRFFPTERERHLYTKVARGSGGTRGRWTVSATPRRLLMLFKQYSVD